MGVIEQARRMRSLIEQVATIIPDIGAAKYTSLFPKWNGDGTVYKLGTRVRVNGTLYKCIQSHTSQEDCNPTSASSLWSKVVTGQEDTETEE